MVSIGDLAFADSSVKAIYIPASVTQIGRDPFPTGTEIYTPAGSPAEAWAGNAYPVIRMN